jgi:dihydrodipicolinate synthase/N-acetylneuraminate lyase
MNPQLPAHDVLRVIPAVLTPLRPDLTPDFDLFVRHCRWLLGTGADG